MYEKTISTLRDMKTLALHIKSLGEIMNITEDPQLKHFLQNVIISIQKAHANPKIKNKSTPQSLIDIKDDTISSLVKYCTNFIGSKKPEWQVLAERNGWVPKS
jgi:hypothetical protein